MTIFLWAYVGMAVLGILSHAYRMMNTVYPRVQERSVAQDTVALVFAILWTAWAGILLFGN